MSDLLPDFPEENEASIVSALKPESTPEAIINFLVTRGYRKLENAHLKSLWRKDLGYDCAAMVAITDEGKVSVYRKLADGQVRHVGLALYDPTFEAFARNVSKAEKLDESADLPDFPEEDGAITGTSSYDLKISVLRANGYALFSGDSTTSCWHKKFDGGYEITAYLFAEGDYHIHVWSGSNKIMADYKGVDHLIPTSFKLRLVMAEQVVANSLKVTESTNLPDFSDAEDTQTISAGLSDKSSEGALAARGYVRYSDEDDDKFASRWVKRFGNNRSIRVSLRLDGTCAIVTLDGDTITHALSTFAHTPGKIRAMLNYEEKFIERVDESTDLPEFPENDDLNLSSEPVTVVEILNARGYSKAADNVWVKDLANGISVWVYFKDSFTASVSRRRPKTGVSYFATVDVSAPSRLLDHLNHAEKLNESKQYGIAYTRDPDDTSEYPDFPDTDEKSLFKTTWKDMISTLLAQFGYQYEGPGRWRENLWTKWFDGTRYHADVLIEVKSVSIYLYSGSSANSRLEKTFNFVIKGRLKAAISTLRRVENYVSDHSYMDRLGEAVELPEFSDEEDAQSVALDSEGNVYEAILKLEGFEQKESTSPRTTLWSNQYSASYRIEIKVYEDGGYNLLMFAYGSCCYNNTIPYAEHPNFFKARIKQLKHEADIDLYNVGIIAGSMLGMQESEELPDMPEEEDRETLSGIAYEQSRLKSDVDPDTQNQIFIDIAKDEFDYDLKSMTMSIVLDKVWKTNTAAGYSTVLRFTRQGIVIRGASDAGLNPQQIPYDVPTFRYKLGQLDKQVAQMMADNNERPVCVGGVAPQLKAINTWLEDNAYNLLMNEEDGKDVYQHWAKKLADNRILEFEIKVVNGNAWFVKQEKDGTGMRCKLDIEAVKAFVTKREKGMIFSESEELDEFPEEEDAKSIDDNVGTLKLLADLMQSYGYSINPRVGDWRKKNDLGDFNVFFSMGSAIGYVHRTGTQQLDYSTGIDVLSPHTVEKMLKNMELAGKGFKVNESEDFDDDSSVKAALDSSLESDIAAEMLKRGYSQVDELLWSRPLNPSCTVDVEIDALEEVRAFLYSEDQVISHAWVSPKFRHMGDLLDILNQVDAWEATYKEPVNEDEQQEFPLNYADMPQPGAGLDVPDLLAGAETLDRRIKISFARYTPESIENGEAEETGWEDEEGVEFDEDFYESYADGIRAVVRFLQNKGVSDNGGADSGTYSSPEMYVLDYGTGEMEEISCHLDNFTEKEMHDIHEIMRGRMSVRDLEPE